MSEGKCRSCGALVVWAKLVSVANPAGRPHPFDAVPSEKGTYERKRGRVSDDWYARFVPEEQRTGPLYVSHFATCPQASRWRS